MNILHAQMYSSEPESGGKKEDAAGGSSRNFGAAPKKTLNIVDVNVNRTGGPTVRKSWAARAEEAIKDEKTLSKVIRFDQNLSNL